MASVLRTMVVDDNADVRDSLVTLLQLLGCEAVAVARGDDALALLLEHDVETPIHLAFVDVSMPGMSGYDLASAYRRSSARAARAMLVAITGWGTMQDRERALSEGFDLHLVKPVDMTQLRLLLDAVRAQTVAHADTMAS
jgi:CheY-like chemotaxis protein